MDEVLARTFNMVLATPYHSFIDTADIDFPAFCKYRAGHLHPNTRHSGDSDLHFVGNSVRSSLSLHTTILFANF